jgi:hypothetical protein
MSSQNKTSIFSFVLSIIGIVFGMKFQYMAYWGSGYPVGMMWFWIGAFLSYVFSLTAILLVLFKTKFNFVGNASKIIISLITIANILWTTFVIIAGLSGM